MEKKKIKKGKLAGGTDPSEKAGKRVKVADETDQDLPKKAKKDKQLKKATAGGMTEGSEKKKAKKRKAEEEDDDDLEDLLGFPEPELKRPRTRSFDKVDKASFSALTSILCRTDTALPLPPALCVALSSRCSCPVLQALLCSVSSCLR